MAAHATPFHMHSNLKWFNHQSERIFQLNGKILKTTFCNFLALLKLYHVFNYSFIVEFDIVLGLLWKGNDYEYFLKAFEHFSTDFHLSCCKKDKFLVVVFFLLLLLLLIHCNCFNLPLLVAGLQGFLWSCLLWSVGNSNETALLLHRTPRHSASRRRRFNFNFLSAATKQQFLLVDTFPTPHQPPSSFKWFLV